VANSSFSILSPALKARNNTAIYGWHRSLAAGAGDPHGHLFRIWTA